MSHAEKERQYQSGMLAFRTGAAFLFLYGECRDSEMERSEIELSAWLIATRKTLRVMSRPPFGLRMAPLVETLEECRDSEMERSVIELLAWLISTRKRHRSQKRYVYIVLKNQKISPELKKRIVILLHA